jgi:hypothetical protein
VKAIRGICDGGGGGGGGGDVDGSGNGTVPGDCHTESSEREALAGMRRGSGRWRVLFDPLLDASSDQGA